MYSPCMFSVVCLGYFIRFSGDFVAIHVLAFIVTVFDQAPLKDLEDRSCPENRSNWHNFLPQ